jgi:hypothetical protein
VRDLGIASCVADLASLGVATGVVNAIGELVFHRGGSLSTKC